MGIPGEGKPPLELPAPRVPHTAGAPTGASGGRGKDGDVTPGRSRRNEVEGGVQVVGESP